MAWTTTDIPDQTGRVAVVTGANSGLGLETARALAGAGAHVVMAARNLEKAERAKQEILDGTPNASLEIVELDLGSLDSIRTAAETILSAHPSVDLLINNAGLMATPEGRTADGFETQFGTNHLGHWALTARLLPGILEAEAGRVVTVTSTARLFGRRINAENPHMEGSYDPWGAYSNSKLANYHFALGLQQEFDRAGAKAQSLVAHPGLSHTNLQVATVDQGGTGSSGRFWKWMAARTGMTAARGALPQLRAATHPKARGGQLYAPRFANLGAAVRRPVFRPGNDESISVLWEVSERETGIAMDVARTMQGA